MESKRKIIKKVLFILCIIFSLIVTIVGIYTLFNIYFVMSSNNGVLYDGFEIPYKNNKPHSPYTLFGVIFFFVGISLLRYFYDKIKEDK